MLYDRSVSTIEENGKKLTVIGLAVPLLLEYIFSQLYGTVNTVILSGYSDEAVSATSVVQQISNIAVLILNMISKGTVIISSVSLGSKNKERTETVAGTGAILILGTSILLGAVLNIFSRQLTGAMNLTGQLHSTASGYLRLVALCLPVTALLSYTNNLLICYGHSRITMASGLFSNIVNLVLSYTALYTGLRLPVSGVEAVAICGGIAQAVGLLISAFFFFKKQCLFKLRFKMSYVWDIVKFGAPAGMSLLSYNLSQAVTTSFITGLGTAVINTKVYVSNILSYTSRVSYSLGNATSIVMGRHRGAHRIDSIKKLYRQNLVIAAICNPALALLVLVFHRQLLSIFTTDPQILTAAFSIMAVDVFVELGRAVNHISENSFNANGDVKTPLITSTVSAWACNVLLSYLLTVVMGYGLMGIWIASLVDEFFKATMYLLRWRSGKWQTIKV